VNLKLADYLSGDFIRLKAQKRQLFFAALLAGPPRYAGHLLGPKISNDHLHQNKRANCSHFAELVKQDAPARQTETFLAAK